MLTKRQRRIGLNYANELAKLAPLAPEDDTRKAVYAVVSKVRKKYGLTADEKKAEVFRLIRLGASTEAELVAETLFHRDEVRKALSTLIEENRIRQQRISLTGNGRPSNCYFLKD